MSARLPGLTLICLLLPLLAAGQTPATQTPAEPPVEAQYVFPTGAGMLFFHVRADKADAFEAVMRRLAQVLAASDDDVRRRQAEHFRMFRSVEQHPNLIYVFVFDPAVPGADYDPVRLLREEVPGEVQALYTDLRDAIIRIERMGLRPIGGGG